MALPHPLAILAIAAGTFSAPHALAQPDDRVLPVLPGRFEPRNAPDRSAPEMGPNPDPDANAPNAPVDDTWLEDRIKELNAKDLETRDRAQLRLATNSSITLDRIEEFLDTADLSPEQLLRLSAVGYSLFEISTRPAMGVEFGTRFGAVGGVTINNTVPGFDAANSLLAGDLILRMDGIPVQDFNHARQIILSFDPDDLITVSVIRNNEPVDAIVRFGSFEQLPNGARPTKEVLRQAWNIRRERRAPDRAEPLIIPLDPSLRPNDPALSPQVAAQAWRAVAQWLSRRLDNPSQLFEARLEDSMRAQRDEAGPDILPAGDERMVDAAAIEPFNNRPMTPEVAAQVRQIDARINALTREQRVAQQQLTDPNIRADRRVELANRVRSIQLEMSRLRDWRRKLLGE